ncbi:Nuclear hormone receptor family member nhr-49 [Toxocara canis]|uniref:Nuclear hormone receptor family member nhr-49 n=1 Tax=Toxocara canis TaxID=6265 RepID=A0A0B2VWR9_TOXCA|nr:Nuclear hormone receptor family member nhr-49 [Toxocara canis]
MITVSNVDPHYQNVHRGQKGVAHLYGAFWYEIDFDRRTRFYTKHVMNGVLESLSQTEECSVCGDVADGYHYGVLSCRGCNAFFRRAITYDLNFMCRRGGNCRVDKNARCACRACRLKKCEKVGMDRRAVQPRRNIASVHLKAESECSFSESAKSSAEPSPTNDFLASPHSAFQSLTVKDEEASPSSSFETHFVTRGLIARLADDYKLQRRKRRLMLCTNVEEVLCDELEVQLKRPAEGSDLASIFRVQMVLMFEWAEKLDEFRRIESVSDKSKILRSFAVRYLLLDSVFHSVELGVRDRIVLVNNSYITPGHIPPFYPGEDADSRTVKLMMYGDNSFRLVEELIAPMIDMQFTVGEMMALRLIIFWNPGGVTLDALTNQIVQSASDMAIRELNTWYIEQNFDDVDARLSSLLLLLPSLANHTQTLLEMVKLIPSFGMMNEWDSPFRDILSL